MMTPPCTPENVAEDLDALRLPLALHGRPGWRALPSAGGAVRVENPDASPEAHIGLAAALAGLGWDARVQPGGWVRVTAQLAQDEYERQLAAAKRWESRRG
jgi:hypothetical protein